MHAAWYDFAEHVPSVCAEPRTGGVAGVVLHWTATPFCGVAAERRRIEQWARGRASSTHFVIGRAGHLYQLVALDEAAQHTRDKGADRARWRRPGASGPVDGWSIGIDLVNVGPLTRRGPRVVEGYAQTVEVPETWLNSYGAPHPGARRSVDGRYFEPYSPAQVTTLAQLAARLTADFPALRARAAWTGHSEIQRGKMDPGPLFPWRVIETATDASSGTAS